MAISLSTEFLSDIQSKNTSLVPVIKIGNLYISTNSSVDYLPLLLNVPSLKESIDLETRKYKISSVNLDVSNYPYEGKRFSERFPDSLNNSPVDIYWVSPSTTIDTGALHIYSGKVRRYDHDDEKVKIVVEDRSQATLHKDLPTAELGFGDDVPPKHRGKKIPMVYGHVNRSPTVLSKTTLGDYFRILIDSDNSDSVFGGSTLNQYAIEGDAKLYIFNGGYIGIAEEGTTDFSAGDFDDMAFDSTGGLQYTTINNYAEMQNVTVQDENAIDYNITSNLGLGIIEGWIIRYPTLVAESSYTYDPDDPLYPLIQSYLTAEYFTNLSNVIDKSNSSSATINRESSNYDFVRATLHIEDIEDKNILACKSYVLTNVYISAQYSHYPFLYASNSSEVDEDGNPINRATLNAVDVLNHVGFSSIVNPYGYNNGYSLAINTANIDLTDDDIWEIFRLKDADNLLNSYKGNTIWDSVNKFNRITFENAPFGTGAGLGVTTIGNQTINLYDLKILQKVIIKNPINNKFFASVNGRLFGDVYFPHVTAPQVINHIVANELYNDTNPMPDYNYDYNNIANYNPLGYITWDYAFTVDKKISSKSLIEGLASASPYIPRFDNMGNFKFDVIPLDGGNLSTDLNGNETIKEVDVIDFSFSRTNISDVKTKVEFKYKWDYARNEFGAEPIRVDIIDLWTDDLASELFTYYGISADHSESTLVVDGVQGKYIRDSATAEKFAYWLLSWNCNQHLKMKVKLPLKYMNIEIGDIVEFDKHLGGGILPYGKKYAKNSSDTLNGQTIYPKFIVVSTNKLLTHIDIEAIQLHKLEVTGCPSGTYDCTGECDGSVVEDVCGTCGGSVDDVADCEECPDGSVEDCEGVCGGSAILDTCGVCGGLNQSQIECWNGSLACSYEDCPPEGFFNVPICSNTQYNNEEDCVSSGAVWHEFGECLINCSCNFDPPPFHVNSQNLFGYSSSGVFQFDTSPCKIIHEKPVLEDGIYSMSFFYLKVAEIYNQQGLRIIPTGTRVTLTADNPNINLQWGVSAVEGDVIEQGDDLHELRFFDGLDNVPIFTWNPDDFQYGDTFIISAKIEIDAYDEWGSEIIEYNYVHIIPIEIEFREYYTAGDMNDDGMWNILDVVAVA